MSQVEKPWVGNMSRYGAINEWAAWETIHRYYYDDQVEEAQVESSKVGIGSQGTGVMYQRLIAAEAETRKKSKTFAANDWLSIEYVPKEVPVDEEKLAQMTLEGCDVVAERFNFKHGPKTLVTVLSADAYTPWTPGKHGFCEDKYPYEKIVLPPSLPAQPDEYRATMVHEYAHVVTLNLSNGMIPLWLDEAIAMVAADDYDDETFDEFARGDAEWLKWLDLSAAFHQDRESEEGREEVYYAYMQSSAIGFYLHSLKGDQGLRDLMDGFANNSFIQNFWMRLKNTQPAEEALQEVYGFGVEDAFVNALDWLKKSRPGR